MDDVLMQTNVLEYLEAAVRQFPHRIVYQDDGDTLCISEVSDGARRLATLISQKVDLGNPVVVISGKNLQTPVAYLGVVYAGCYYVPISTDMPESRIRMILDFVAPAAVIVDDENADWLKTLAKDFPIILCSDAKYVVINSEELACRRMKQADDDPLYVIFTSGSSGMPKGVMTSHRAVIDYIDAFADTFDIGTDDVLGNQAPLDYIAAIRDIYLPLKTGARTVLIPKSLFSMPKQLFDYVNDHGVTTLCWVASALSLCCEFGVFDEVCLEKVSKVVFTGSVLPTKHLRVWQENLPRALFANCYGPTEVTASCSYHIVDHIVSETEVIPIGTPFNNSKMFLLSEENEMVPAGEIGEICVYGSSLALGYYRDQRKTDECFISNPLDEAGLPRIYRTGDLGSITSDGVMYFCGRKDSQIKHMGHRIELSEIESTAQFMSEISHCVCLYNDEKKLLWLYYVGEEVGNKEVALHMREWLPSHMVPRKFVKLDAIPRLANGKVDTVILKDMMKA